MDMGTEQAQQPLSDAEIAMRLAAETKQLTINPVTELVRTENFSDAQIVAQHTSGPALANTSIDIEQTQPDTAHSAVDRRSGGHIFAIALTSAVLVIAAGTLYLVTLPR